MVRKPPWLKVSVPGGFNYGRVRHVLSAHGLHTVCDEARCPNKAECWGAGTATFMVLGDACTRNCGFCAVKTSVKGNPVDDEEPAQLAQAVRELGLRYVVVTSVDRDDLPDYGSGHFAGCINAVRESSPEAGIEVLIPDFNGSLECLKTVVEAGPDVIAHNVETVRRLTPGVRDSRGSYEKSLNVLKNVKELDEDVKTKSSMLLGLGESKGEVMEAMRDLRSAGVDYLVLGQYLRPTRRQLPVVEYITPESFEEYGTVAVELGFSGVESSPLARTSYHAAELF
jgi:lipoic acid synthetase